TYTDAASPQTRKHDAGFRAGIIRKAVAAARAQQGGQPAANHAPCDAGEICIDCQPRRADGSCPDGPAASAAPIHQYRVRNCADRYDGLPDHSDGKNYEVRTLYADPVAQEPVAFLCRECDEEGWS